MMCISVVGCHGTTGDIVIGWLNVGAGGRAGDDALTRTVACSCPSL